MRVQRAATATATIAAVLLGASDCHQTTSQPPPDVVDEMRAVGKVVASTTTEWFWESYTDIDQVVVVDVGPLNPDDAVATAIRTLRQRGWLPIEDVPNTPLLLESRSWAETRIWVEPLVSYEVPHSEGFNDQLDASNARLFGRLHAQGGAGAFVVLTAKSSWLSG
ncbi:hypothetical protein [Nonomuraea endophytica]|uniref:Uncharacterized protein n=1 Tax=Nonomuraea endophytica TaxID=714136 RepID=A0A7W8A2A8_9ACTN|nr:hypothetical protein [Nonomuraea endophytica]MBB5078210.1 hypothetical protein [Nonomuraea endophytica]